MRYPFSLLFILVCTLLPLAPARADGSADEALARQIARHLKNSGKLKGYQIGIKTDNGTAWLTGRVASSHQQQAALDIARKTPGVRQVVNRLKLSDAAEMHEAQAVAGQGPVANPKSMAESGAAEAALQGGLRVKGRGSRARKPEFSGAEASLQDAFPVLANADPSVSEGPPRAVAAIHPHPRRARSIPLGSAIAQGIPSADSADGVAMMTPIPTASRVSRARFDEPAMPAYAWPSYASYPNYAALTYPTQYSPTAWPYIGPFYPYPQVPLGWRKVTLEWDDGWWFLDFKD